MATTQRPRSETPAPPTDQPTDGWIGHGEIARLIRSMDWAATPLGPIASWPQSLRTTVSLVQASSVPISVLWGPDHVQLYNDGYAPLCGAKHPAVLGRDFRVCWASAFPVIGDAYARAWAGHGAYCENMRMFIDRHGFLEEAWFTFGFSPIIDESGGVGGVFQPVTEVTSHMLSERRTKLLRELASRTASARTPAQACEIAMAVLGEAALDLPFALLYRVDENERQATLIGRVGLAEKAAGEAAGGAGEAAGGAGEAAGEAAGGAGEVPATIGLEAEGDGAWRVAAVVRTQAVRAIELGDALAGQVVGPYPEVPTTALALPVMQPRAAGPAAVLVVGLSARLAADEAYLDFCAAVGAAVSAAVVNARAYEEAQARAEALATLERELDAIIEHLPSMVFVKDAERLEFTRINRAGEALLGIDRSALLGKNDHDFFPPEQAAFFVAKDREALAGRAPVDIVEEPIETPAGRRWLHTKKVPIVDGDGRPRFLLGISEDITARKQDQEALVRARDAAETANRELEAFSHSVAHDLRAPLRGIDGFAQALVEEYHDRLDDDGRRYLRFVRESAQRMGLLIDDLLNLSRVTRSELVRQPIDVSAIARTALGRLTRVQPERTIEVVIADGLVARADPRLLAVVFDNLIGNAWKFTRRVAAPRVEVGAEDTPRGRAFFVRDNGAGFDETYADKLFGVFQRLHAAADFEGTGVGLATVQRIVHRHGGSIWARGRVGEGATFHFTLDEANP